MRVVVFSILLLIFSLGTLQSQDAYRRGDMLFDAKRYTSALKEYERALAVRPNDMYALIKAARCNIYTGNLDQAAVYINKVENGSPFLTVEFLRTKAEFLHMSYEFQDAMAYYKKADPNGVAFPDTKKRIYECEVGRKYWKKVQDVKIQNLGSAVNSEYHDVLPKITADFRLMYFTSQREGAIGNSGNPEDVYLTAHNGQEWVRPLHLPGPLNTELNEACVGLSQDGQTMFLFRGSNNGDLFIAHLDGAKWSSPEPFQHNTSARESSMCVSPDGRMLLFVRKEEGKSADIMYCNMTEAGVWSEPRPVSGGVNSSYDEASPYLHPDGKTLYFSSKGHDSMGGYDIFKSVFDGERWSSPENLGAPINTPGDDMNFVLSASGELGFYSSIKAGGFGGQDLYVVSMPKSERDKRLVLMKGTIADATDQQVLQADIWIIDNETGKEIARFKSNSKTGDYLVALPAGKDYGVRIEKEGYLFYSENVYLEKDKEFESLENNVNLEPSRKGVVVTMRNIFFESGSYSLDKRSYPELDRLVSIMQEKPSMKIQVSGHTDNVGKDVDNKTLSMNRAMAVKAYLVSKGVGEDRITSVGYGSEKPVASNKDASGRSLNRRTEFVILED